MKTLILATCAMLAGCCGPGPIKYEYVEVKVEKPVYCNPPELAKPDLAVYSISTSSPNDETAKAYVTSVRQLQQHIEKQDEIVKRCRDPKLNQALPSK